MSDNTTDTSTTNPVVAQEVDYTQLTDRQIIEQTNRGMIATKTLVLNMGGDLGHVKQEVKDIRHIIAPDKIKFPNAKGMMDADAEHDQRISTCEEEINDLKLGPSSADASSSAVATEEKKTDNSIWNNLSPREKLIAVVFGMGVVGGGGAGLTDVLKFLGGGG